MVGGALCPQSPHKSLGESLLILAASGAGHYDIRQRMIDGDQSTGRFVLSSCTLNKYTRGGDSAFIANPHQGPIFRILTEAGPDCK